MVGSINSVKAFRRQAYEGESVPAVLLSSDHEAVRRWREREALELTKSRRPDLINELDLWGNKVVLYKFPYAGFLCEG